MKMTIPHWRIMMSGRFSRLSLALMLCAVVLFTGGWSGKPEETTKKLVAEESSPQKLSEMFIISASLGHVEAVLKLLYLVPDINAKDLHGRTALMYAAGHGHMYVVRILLEKNLEVKSADGSKKTIPLNADINAQDNNGATALTAATVKGYTGIVQLLLANGADVNLGGKDGNTPLILASIAGHKCIVQTLLKNKANPRITNRDGFSASDGAKIFKHTEVVTLLETFLKQGSISSPDCPGKDKIEYALAKYDELLKAFNDNPSKVVLVASEFLSYLNSNFSPDIGQYYLDWYLVMIVAPNMGKSEQYRLLHQGRDLQLMKKFKAELRNILEGEYGGK